MGFEGHHQAQLLERCWSIYRCLPDAFTLPESFHVEFPVVVESALLTGTLHVTVPMAPQLTLSLREEYGLVLQL